MARYLFSSHDGFGLGHTRRNYVIARALLAADPAAEIVLVTGLAQRVAWLVCPGLSIVAVPALVKSSEGGYAAVGMSFGRALEERARIFAETVSRCRPDVVVVDRHPFGISGELRPGLEQARAWGSRLVLGLRDILDQQAVVRLELAGAGWSDADEFFEEVLVYGQRQFCDHEAEYGLHFRPRYCGWVTSPPRWAPRERLLLAVSAGGGGDGSSVFRLGVAVVGATKWRAEFLLGPYADHTRLRPLLQGSPGRDRVGVVDEEDGCGSLFARASAVLQMAGYNSTFEALAAGHRPVLVPRRAPRSEQAIRAERLAALGLADVVAEDASPAEVAALLERPRRNSPERLARSGIDLNGAPRVAAQLVELAAKVRR